MVELKQAIQALAETTDERIATLATDLRAETATRTDEIRRVDELAQTVAAIAEELKTQTENVERARTADAKAATTATGQLRERLDEVVALRATDAEAIQAARAEAGAAAAEAVRIEEALRSELDALAARRAEAEPAERVKELAQTIDALAQAMDDRLGALAAELRAETAASRENTLSQVLAQSDELAASVDAIRETATGRQAETRQIGDRLADESRSLAARVDELADQWADGAEAAEVAQERPRPRSPASNRVSWPPSPSSPSRLRISRIGSPGSLPPGYSESLPLDDEPSTPISDARDPQIKKRSKRVKGKKKPKH